MSKLSIQEVEHIAHLSKLELAEAEKNLYADQLSSVLDYVGQLSEVETEKIEPTANVTGLASVFREDVVEKSSITHDDIARNAPDFDGKNIVVPGVFE